MLEMIELLIRIWMHHKTPGPTNTNLGDRSDVALDPASVERALLPAAFDLDNNRRQ